MKFNLSASAGNSPLKLATSKREDYTLLSQKVEIFVPKIIKAHEHFHETTLISRPMRSHDVYRKNTDHDTF